MATAKQIASAKKNLMAWEKKQFSVAMMTGFVAGASVVLIACFVALGIVKAI